MKQPQTPTPEPEPPFRTTREVCDLLGDVPESLVHDAVRRRFLPAPRIVGGIRLWSSADIAALREVLATRSARRAERVAAQGGRTEGRRS